MLTTLMTEKEARLDQIGKLQMALLAEMDYVIAERRKRVKEHKQKAESLMNQYKELQAEATKIETEIYP